MMETVRGVVIRQTKAIKNRRMILLFTDRYGKISAGTSISERGKSKSALALRPFTYGVYEIRSGHRGGRDNFSIVDGETISTCYGVGDDYEKFAGASLVLEFTGKVLPEAAPAGDQFEMLLTYFDLASVRKSHFETLTIAYMVKTLQLFGVFPDRENLGSDSLLSSLRFDIVNVLGYLLDNPLTAMQKMALDKGVAAELLQIIIRYSEEHLDIGRLKSNLPMIEG